MKFISIHSLLLTFSLLILSCAPSEAHPVYQTIILPVNQSDVEATWASALADTLCGEEEVRVTYGRVDVLTDSLAIEVDRFAKYHEGIGQAIHYRVETNRQGAVALMIDKGEINVDKAQYIYEKLCLPLGLDFIILEAEFK